MIQVAFWSSFHGQPGTTANAIATSMYTAMNYKLKVLLTHSQYAKSSMESAFVTDNEEESLIKFNDFGIDSLERLARAGKLSSGDFYNYTKNIIPKRLDLLTGSTKLKKELFNNIYDTIIEIFRYARECYDIVFVDVNSGNKDKITEKVLDDSDIIVVSLNQNEKILKSFFEKKDWIDALDKKKIVLVLGRYDLNSKCSVKYVRSTYGWKDEIYTVPYVTSFMDCCNNHNVKEFFYANNSTAKHDEANFFMEEVQRLANRILDLSNIEIVDKEPIEKKSLIRTIFNVG